MDESLREILYSKKNKGLIGFQELYRLAKATHPALTLKKAKAFIDSQENTQIFKPTRKDLFNPIVAPDHTYQCDLLFLKQSGKLNPIFVMLEITTRKGFLRLMKDKSALSTAIALQSILDEEKPIIKTIEHDDGKEFQGEFDELLQQENIDNVTFPKQENSKTSLGKVERLNRSIRQWWNKSYKGNESISAAIPEIQEFYNQREHGTTHQIPDNTTTPKQIAVARNIDNLRGANPRNRIRQLYKKGSQVRLREETDIFKKKSDAKWKRQTHTITDVNGINFKVSGEDRDFRAWEMLPVGTTQKAPERAQLPPEPMPVPALKRKLTKELAWDFGGAVEEPRTRSKAPVIAPAPVKKPEPKEKVLDIPEKILAHMFTGTSLTFTIQWRDSPAFRKKWEKYKAAFVDWDKLISDQPYQVLTSAKENNIVIAEYLLTLKDREEVKKIARKTGITLRQLDEVQKIIKREERQARKPAVPVQKPMLPPVPPPQPKPKSREGHILAANIVTEKRRRK
jgi:hypothetical protein